MDHGIFLPQNRVMCLHNEDNGTTEERGHEMEWAEPQAGGARGLPHYVPSGPNCPHSEGKFYTKGQCQAR